MVIGAPGPRALDDSSSVGTGSVRSRNYGAAAKPVIPIPADIMSAADLRDWRRTMGYTQREAALALGLSAGGYADLETGKGGRLDPFEPERARRGRGRRYVPRIVALAAAAVQAGLYPYIAPPESAPEARPAPLPVAQEPPVPVAPRPLSRGERALAEWDKE